MSCYPRAQPTLWSVSLQNNQASTGREADPSEALLACAQGAGAAAASGVLLALRRAARRHRQPPGLVPGRAAATPVPGPVFALQVLLSSQPHVPNMLLSPPRCPSSVLRPNSGPRATRVAHVGCVYPDFSTATDPQHELALLCSSDSGGVAWLAGLAQLRTLHLNVLLCTGALRDPHTNPIGFARSASHASKLTVRMQDPFPEHGSATNGDAALTWTDRHTQRSQSMQMHSNSVWHLRSSPTATLR